MHSFSLATLSAAAVAMSTAPAAAQRPAAAPDIAAIADRVFTAWNNTHGPSCAVGVSRGGVMKEMHFGESRVWDITTVRVP
ncbi:MAG: hypothetical protein HEQ38_00250 [Gemmatimonas sp.]|jgi:hypothetical protein|nr:hypothetical protein [Gemmatimonas sp.]